MLSVCVRHAWVGECVCLACHVRSCARCPVLVFCFVLWVWCNLGTYDTSLMRWCSRQESSTEMTPEAGCGLS